jgi:hypothetical protein
MKFWLALAMAFVAAYVVASLLGGKLSINGVLRCNKVVLQIIESGKET